MFAEVECGERDQPALDCASQLSAPTLIMTDMHKETFNERHINVERLSLYEVLKVSETASVDEIKVCSLPNELSVH